ncbi:MAG: lysostaphin resistance A-like protein [Candidatus Heimdallarchaeota archaeon]
MEDPTSVSILRRDLIYPFAVVLVLLLFLDISRGVAGASFLAFFFLQILQIDSSTYQPIANLILILFSQVGAVSLYILMSRKEAIEPDDVRMPPGNHWRSLYFVYTLLLLFLVAGLTLIDRILQTQLGTSITETFQISTGGLGPTAELADFPPYIFLYIVVIVIGASIAEELIFRRTLIPFLERRGFGTFWILILSSMLFASIHTPLDLFQNSLHYAALNFASIFASGVAFGYIYIRTRNVLYPIVLHGISNGFLALSTLAIQSNDRFIITLAGYWLLIGILVGFLVFVGVLFTIERYWDSDGPQPTWLLILKDVNIRRSRLLPVLWLILVFAIIEGGRNVIIMLIPAVLEQFGIYQEFLEMIMEVLLLFPLMGIISFFIFRVGAPLAAADSVSRIKVQETLEKPSEICDVCGASQLTLYAEFCGDCGTPFKKDEI